MEKFKICSCENSTVTFVKYHWEILPHFQKHLRPLYDHSLKKRDEKKNKRKKEEEDKEKAEKKKAIDEEFARELKLAEVGGGRYFGREGGRHRSHLSDELYK